MPARKPLVLIVNDDPDLVEAMKAVLRDAGYEVRTTVHRIVEEVIEVAPDLLMLDIPPYEEKHAINFLQRLRLEERTAKIPVLVGTTSLRFIEPEALRDKMIYVLVRPFEIADLLKATGELVRTARRTS